MSEKEKLPWSPGRRKGAKNRVKSINIGDVPELIAAGEVSEADGYKLIKSSPTLESNTRIREALKEQAREKKELARKYKTDEIAAEFEGLNNAQRLRITHEELIRRLAVESHRNYIREVDYDNSESMRIRKMQMDNLRSLLAITNQMFDLIERLEKIQGHNSITSSEDKAEAESIMAAATKLLEPKLRLAK
jgi:hypothetical protein